MTIVLFANNLYSEQYSYAVLKETEQSFDFVHSYKVKKGKNTVMDIGS